MSDKEDIKEIGMDSKQPFTNTRYDESHAHKLPKQLSQTKFISPFAATSEELLDIIGDRNVQGVIERAEAAGGVKTLAEQLHSDLTHGLSASDNLAVRAQVFGHNVLPKGKERNLLRIVLEVASDK